MSEKKRLKADLKQALTLLRAMVQEDDCWFDHHGGCQEHGYLSLEPTELCPHAEAKLLLAKHEVPLHG